MMDRRSSKSLACEAPEAGRARINRAVAELFLDADELVVLCEPVRPREAAGLDLPAVGRDGEVGDGRVLGLARAVAHHRGVAAALRQADRLQRLGKRADLVDLDQQRVRETLADAHLQ